MNERKYIKYSFYSVDRANRRVFVIKERGLDVRVYPESVCPIESMAEVHFLCTTDSDKIYLCTFIVGRLLNLLHC